MKIGFIGFGEASSNIADGLLSENENINISAFDIDTEKVKKTIMAFPSFNRITVLSSLKQIIDYNEVLLCAIPGDMDYSLFVEVASYQIRGKLFIDLCTAKPTIKKTISGILSAKGADYVDVAVAGSVPANKHKVPMLISGSGSSKMLDLFQPYKMDITFAGEEAGNASIIKLCRSIYMKGLAALSLEMSNVAEYFGIKDFVYDSLAKSFDCDHFTSYTPRLINGTKKHILRRTKEVEDWLELIKGTGCSNYITLATLKTYET